MKKYFILFVVLFSIFILLLSCNKVDRKSVLLNEYLENTFSLNLDNLKYKNIYMIFIQDQGCQACQKALINKIIEKKAFENKNTFIFYVTNSKLIPEDLNIIKNSNGNFFIDNNNNFNKYDISPFQDVIIKVKNKKIIDIMDFNNIDSELNLN